MARLNLVAQTDEIATGTDKKTLLQLVAAANHRVAITEISVSFTGTSTTGTPIQVEVARQSDAGTMSSLTLLKINADDDETIQTTAQHTATAEPTETAVLMRENVHPQSGYTWQAPFGKELILNGGDRIGITAHADASVNAVVRAFIEE